MQHAVREERGALVVSLRGDFDLAESPRARELLLESVARSGSVFVDLSGVTYIDSSGVASLVEAFQLARSKGSGFALVSVGREALRVLQLSRLDRVFTIHEALADGLCDHG